MCKLWKKLQRMLSIQLLKEIYTLEMELKLLSLMHQELESRENQSEEIEKQREIV